MKQKLQLLMTLLLLFGGVSAAWAERDTSKPIYCPVNDGSYDNIKEAYDAIKSNDATELEIQIWGTRPTLGTAADSKITAIAGKTLSIVPKVSGIILTAGSHNRGNIWFLNNLDNATLNIGSSEYIMTIEGYGFNDNNTQLNAVCANEKKGVMNITKVTFQKFRLGSEIKESSSKYGYIYANKVANTSNTEGYVTMTDVKITNSYTSNDAFINSINTNNDAICLKGSFTIEHKDSYTEPVFYLKGRIRLGDKSGESLYSGFSAPSVIGIKWDGSSSAIGTSVVVKAPKTAAALFDLTDEDKGLAGNGTDLKLTQAYTLPVNSYGASTLVLPFESTIPTGATCYTLNYTAGKSSVKATEVTTTLAANTPVLVNASEGSYKFVSTATSGAATGSGTHTSGALTGVYTTTNVPEGSYILWANESNPVGFYKANSSTVAANRAYLTADGAGARSLSIVFDDDITAINSVRGDVVNDNRYYTLSGQQVAQPTKGLYIVNGKKVIIK